MDFPEINGYKIIEKIGEGSYGSVFKAQSAKSGRIVALKVVKPRPEGGKNHERRALDFYVRMRESSKKGIVQILDIGRTSDGMLYYAMPLGQCTLFDLANQKLKQKTWFTLPEIKKILSRLFDGLQSLENEGLVHRDIKPTNIIFVDGEACLSDLGLLEIEDDGSARYGTENFCAPEYFSGNPDHWSVACVIFFLLTSEYPEKWNSHNSWVSPLGAQKMSREDAAEYERLRNVILNRATAYRAIDTFRTAAEFRIAVLEPEKPRKTRIFAAAFSLAAVFALAVLAFYFVWARGGSREENPARQGEGKPRQARPQNADVDIFAQRDALFGVAPSTEPGKHGEESNVDIDVESAVAGAGDSAKKHAQKKSSAEKIGAGGSARDGEKFYEIDDKLFAQIKESGYSDDESGVKIFSFSEWADACRGVGEDAQKLLAQKNLLCFGIDADFMKDAQKLKYVKISPQNSAVFEWLQEICRECEIAKAAGERGEAMYRKYAAALKAGAGAEKSLFGCGLQRLGIKPMEFLEWGQTLSQIEEKFFDLSEGEGIGGAALETFKKSGHFVDISRAAYEGYLKSVDAANAALAEIQKPAAEYR